MPDIIPGHAGNASRPTRSRKPLVPKREIVLSLAAIVLFSGTPGALAQKAAPGADYPVRPVRIVVPFTPGGQPDIFTRMIVPGLAEAFGQQVIVDNRPGAGGSIGSRIVADAAPDGYTLLSVSSGHAINPFLYKLPYDTLKSFAGVTRTYSAPFLLVAAPTLNVKTVKDLIALARAKPGQLNFGSAGQGSGTHFAGEMLRHSAAIDVVHVPYRGIPEAMTDLLAGRAQFFMAPIGSSAQLVREGKLRGLGVSTLKRSPALPDIPTIAESGLPGFEWDAWGSLLAPAGTPRALIERWNREVTRAGGAPDVVKRLGAIGMVPAPSGPTELEELIRQQMAVVAKLAKAAGLKPE
jgi:tripartite-type tricarboxylate transporter receptor subunit TctC